MSSLAKFLLGGLGLGTVRDYSHAAKTFRSNGFANAGRYKFLFHVYFNMNPAVGAMSRTLSYLVKKIELPKFTVDLKELNQYNRKQITQTKIKYNPINITFQDDNAAQIRELWRAYYNYYYADGRYQGSIYNFNDLYIGTRLNTNWGLNAGSYEPFFNSIDIYSLHGGEAAKISIINPIISSFNHDSHDYAEGSALLEHTMTFNYTSVKYENGYYSGTPGFGDFAFYDNVPSDLAGDYAGHIVDPSTGRVFFPDETFTDAYDQQIDEQERIRQQLATSENYNKNTIVEITPLQVNSFIEEQNKTNSEYIFPNVIIGSNVNVQAGAVAIGTNVFASSENTILDDDRKYLGTYESGTWQRALEEKGYRQQDITIAEDYINQGILTNELNITNNGIAQIEAEKYLRNPVKYSQGTDPVYLSTATDFAVNTQTLNNLEPIYNARGWQQQLLDKGYTIEMVSFAESTLSRVRISSSVDIAAVAEDIIIKNYRN
jgi:hypothetical protein